jgi:hypothetical protein
VPFRFGDHSWICIYQQPSRIGNQAVRGKPQGEPSNIASQVDDGLGRTSAKYEGIFAKCKQTRRRAQLIERRHAVYKVSWVKAPLQGKATKQQIYHRNDSKDGN